MDSVKLVNHDKNVIDVFEHNWAQWNVNDLISWFKYIIAKTEHNYKNDISIENVMMPNLDDMKHNQYHLNNKHITPNWSKIAKRLNALDFEPKILPNMEVPFLKCLGFENDRVCQTIAFVKR